MPSPARSFAVLFALGVVALLCTGLFERRSDAFTLGVAPAIPIYVGANATLCQAPVDVPDDFSALRLTVAAAVVSSPPATVTIRDAATGARLAEGVLNGRYPSAPTRATVKLSEVPAGRRIRICISPTRRGGLLVFGNAGAAVRGSSASLNGKPRNRDVDMVFLREDKASVLSLAGEIVQRASLFHGGLVGAWTVWAVVVLLLTAFPALLVLALRHAGEQPADQPTASASE